MYKRQDVTIHVGHRIILIDQMAGNGKKFAHIARMHAPDAEFLTPEQAKLFGGNVYNPGEFVFIFILIGLIPVAAALFLLAMVPHLFEHHVKYILRGVAYVFGAGAYASEMLMLTDNFKHMHPFREMFMPYAFGVLYVLMAISYFLEA